MVEEGEICDDLWFRRSLAWAGRAECDVWSVMWVSVRQNVRQEGMLSAELSACTWRPAAARDGTILQFSSLPIKFPARKLFKLSIFTCFYSRYLCLANPILWVSHSRTGWYSWQGSRSIFGLTHVVTGPGVMVSSLSWLWSGFNQFGDSDHDTLSAPVKWKFNKISEQKKNPPYYYVPFQWSDTFLDVFTL